MVTTPITVTENSCGGIGIGALSPYPGCHRALITPIAHASEDLPPRLHDPRDGQYRDSQHDQRRQEDRIVRRRCSSIRPDPRSFGDCCFRIKICRSSVHHARFARQQIPSRRHFDFPKLAAIAETITRHMPTLPVYRSGEIREATVSSAGHRTAEEKQMRPRADHGRLTYRGHNVFSTKKHSSPEDMAASGRCGAGFCTRAQQMSPSATSARTRRAGCPGPLCAGKAQGVSPAEYQRKRTPVSGAWL